MKRWIGRWLAVIGVMQVIVGLLYFNGMFREILAAGVVNALGVNVQLHLAFWYTICGPFIFLVGVLADWIESRNEGRVPRLLGVVLLPLTIAGMLISPWSGFVLYLPPVIGALLRPIRPEKVQPIRREEGLVFPIGRV